MTAWRYGGWAVLWLCLSCQSAAATLEYLYINASEGTASGGHVALKLDEEVYHFQHVPPGLLRIKRDEFAQFRQQYGDRENRTIRLHRIKLAGETQDRLREQFNRILLIENEQFDRRDGLEHDRRLLQSLLKQSSPEQSQTDDPLWLDLKGLGLFLADGWTYDPRASHPQGPAHPSLARLAEKAEASFGNGFLPAKMQALWQSLHRLQPADREPQTIQLSEDRFLPAEYSFSDRYTDQLTALAALQVLTQGAALREGVLLRLGGEAFRLNDSEIAHLADYRARLENQLLGLLQSQRPDWGFPLVLGMARLVALDETLATGRLAFLSLANPAEPTASPPIEADEMDKIQALHRARFLQAKAGIGQKPVDEWDYVRLEQRANLHNEFGRAMREGRNPRWAELSRTPDRPALARLIPTTLAPAQLQAHLDRLEAYRQVYDAQLDALYAYRLVGRNCASEIFRVIDSAVAVPSSGPDAGEVRFSAMEPFTGGDGLGWKPARPAQAMAFIPFLSYEIVGQSWPVTASEELPSYRNRRLAELRAGENPLLVELRESNVLSSRLYRWNKDDSAFLFFSDDRVWARPIAGAFNLATGLAQGLAGVFTLPWDGGENLWQGTKGSLISLPELVFFNIRKGSFPGLAGGAE